jgi:hypothetical protein
MAKGEVVDVAKHADILTSEVLVEAEDSTALQRSIIESNLRAESIGDLFADEGTIAAKDYLGIPIEVIDVRLAEGEVEGKPANYMLIDAVNLDSGEKVILNTGAPNITSKLLNAKLRGWLPMQVAVKEVGRAKGGRNAPIGLEAVGTTLERIG